MTSNPVASRMVGRAAELHVLLDAFHAGERGEARAVIVRGEAGIGKTRLISEFIGAVTGRADNGLPVFVASGQCVDLGPIGAPLTSIRRMLRELHTGVGDDAFRAAAGGTATLATMGTLVPGLVSDMPATSAGDAAYVAEAIERVLEELSRDAHLVLVVEDLHWADTATLALLATLTGTMRGAHLTLIATYRSGEARTLAPGHLAQDRWSKRLFRSHLQQFEAIPRQRRTREEVPRWLHLTASTCGSVQVAERSSSSVRRSRIRNLSTPQVGAVKWWFRRVGMSLSCAESIAATTTAHWPQREN